MRGNILKIICIRSGTSLQWRLMRGMLFNTENANMVFSEGGGGEGFHW